jgi:superfamily I DNA/RNA helicase
MKTLTGKIIEALENRLKQELCSTNEYWYKAAIHDAIVLIEKIEKEAEFEEVAREMMKHLGNGNSYTPYHTAIITNNTFQLVESQKVLETLEYVPD